MIGNTQNQMQTSAKRKKKIGEPSSRAKVQKKAEVFTKEELDLKRQYYSLAHYVEDKNILIDQLFGILSEQDLRKIVPASLQGYNLNDLKQKCNAELLKLDEDYILGIIQASYPSNDCGSRNLPAGADANKNSSNVSPNPAPPLPPPQRDEVDDDQQQQDNDFEDESQGGELTLELCPNQNEIDSLIDESIEKISRKETEPKEDIPDVFDINKEDQSLSKTIKKTSNIGEEWVSTLAKSQLEILELEMRARAIRSLMKSQGMCTANEDAQLESIPVDNYQQEKTVPLKTRGGKMI